LSFHLRCSFTADATGGNNGMHFQCRPSLDRRHSNRQDTTAGVVDIFWAVSRRATGTNPPVINPVATGTSEPCDCLRERAERMRFPRGPLLFYRAEVQRKARVDHREITRGEHSPEGEGRR